jgi:hypothetical protein
MRLIHKLKLLIKKDHARNPNLTSTTTRSRGETLNIPVSAINNYMTDAEAALIRKSHAKVPPKDESLSLNSSLRNSNSNLKNINDYLAVLSSATRARSASSADSRSKPPAIFKIVTDNFKAQKFN